MKKLLILSITFILSYSVQAQEVSEGQWTILTKKTADWCPKCGDWGWDFFDKAIDTQGEKDIIIWAAHHSGGLSNDISSGIANNFSVPGQPVFYLDSDDFEVTSSNVAEKVDELDYLVDAIVQLEASEVVGSEVVVGPEDVTVKQKVQFRINRNVIGDFFIGTYIVDNELIAYQSSQGNEAIHKSVILGEISGTPFGEAIPDGSYLDGEEVVLEKTISLADFPYGIEGLSLVTVLWTTDNGKHYFINGNVQSITDGTNVAVIETLPEEKLILSDVRNNSLRFEIDNKDFIGDTEVNLISTTGQVITKQNMTLNSGVENTLRFSNLSSGIYVLSVRNDKKRISKRFYLQ